MGCITAVKGNKQNAAKSKGKGQHGGKTNGKGGVKSPAKMQKELGLPLVARHRRCVIPAGRRWRPSGMDCRLPGFAAR